MKAHRFPLAAALLLVAAALPLAQVSAHACSSMAPVSPADPGDPDTGCNGSSCPCKSAPHDHANTVPQQDCQKEKTDCEDRRGGCPPRDVEFIGIVEFASLNVRVACAIVDGTILIARDGALGDVVNADVLP